MHSVPVITTLGSAFAALDGIRSLREEIFPLNHYKIIPISEFNNSIALRC